MDKSENHVRLTSAEIAALWTAYMNACMSKCMLSFMIKHIVDEEIYPAVEQTLKVSKTQVEQLIEIFKEENFAIPIGFGDDDVDVNAPSLYTDTFCLTYINHMGRAGMIANSGFISMSARKDIRSFFTKALNDTSKIYNETTDIALNKGVFVRAPYISVPSEPDYIDSKGYLSGFHLFNKQRPVNAVEISHLYMNTQTNLIGTKLCLSFAQTSPTKEVQQFMLRGNEISKKHMKVFTSALLDNNIQSPISSDVCVTDSIVPPFSDKLMMFHMGLLSAAGTGNYATAAAASQRTDLVVDYERLSIEIGQYAKEGADIMIKNQWLEQPPGTVDKEKLATKKRVK
ncbi:DUF3231 family protein [Evansella sp. AB-P1]|uniref:DUF3231 family protein n=1 Tax=Evansella sp. AB-P1 TaxID=3037653 RepID=UPI00241F9CB3|nr:DUF3231 family protein [Evansella sp. AB-P1]MDG5789366.1 DUF3231 family protein [Evansella sp. AB-P1]